MKSRTSSRPTRRAQQVLAAGALTAVLMILEACSGNASVSTGVGIHRSSNGNWGHSISVGVHSHGRGW